MRVPANLTDSLARSIWSAPSPARHDAWTSTERRQRAIRLWLYAVAALIFAMVLVGGATRLTESGLSIVEWKPVTGTLPPLSEAAWQAEFDKYKTIPQFRQLNSGMTLDEFKTIFWWEWTHRLMGRADRRGVPAAVPVVPVKGWIEPGLRWRLWAIFGARRAAGRGRLVDGGVGPRRARRGLAIPAGDPSHPRLRDLRRDRCGRRRGMRERAADRGAAAHSRDGALALLGAGAGADLSRRAGRGPARRADLQHLAADRRRLHAGCGAAVLRDAAVAQFLREHADGAVQSPHDGLCAVAARAAACVRCRAARARAARR